MVTTEQQFCRKSNSLELVCSMTHWSDSTIECDVCSTVPTEDGVVSWFDRLEMQRYLKPLVQRVSLLRRANTLNQFD